MTVMSSLRSSNRHPQGSPILPTPVLVTMGTNSNNMPLSWCSGAAQQQEDHKNPLDVELATDDDILLEAEDGDSLGRVMALIKRSKRVAFRVGFLISSFRLAIVRVLSAVTEQRHHDASFLDFDLQFLIWLPRTFDACILVGLFFLTCFGTKRGNTERSERLVHRLVAGIDKELARKTHVLDDDGWWCKNCACLPFRWLFPRMFFVHFDLWNILFGSYSDIVREVCGKCTLATCCLLALDGMLYLRGTCSSKAYIMISTVVILGSAPSKRRMVVCYLLASSLSNNSNIAGPNSQTGQFVRFTLLPPQRTRFCVWIVVDLDWISVLFKKTRQETGGALRPRRKKNPPKW
jgi:hypothetical protein